MRSDFNNGMLRVACCVTLARARPDEVTQHATRNTQQPTQRAVRHNLMAFAMHGAPQNGVTFSQIFVNQPRFWESETAPLPMILMVASATL